MYHKSLYAVYTNGETHAFSNPQTQISNYDDHLFIALIMFNTFITIMRHFPDHCSLAVAVSDPRHLLCACRESCCCCSTVMCDGCYLNGVLISPHSLLLAISCHQSPLNGVTHLISMTTAWTWMSPALQPMGGNVLQENEQYSSVEVSHLVSSDHLIVNTTQC